MRSYEFKVESVVVVGANSKKEAETKLRDVLAKSNCFSSYLIHHDRKLR